MPDAPADQSESQRVERREQQCPHRDGPTCADINARLGWEDRIAWSTCDFCHSSGPDSAAGRAVRVAYTTKVVLTVKRTIHQHRANVVRAYAEKHAPPDERRDLLAWLRTRRPGWMFVRDHAACLFNRMFRQAFEADKHFEAQGRTTNYKERLIRDMEKWSVPR